MFLSVLQVLEGALEIWFAWGVVLRIAGFGGVSGGGVASTFVCPEEGIGSRFVKWPPLSRQKSTKNKVDRFL